MLPEHLSHLGCFVNRRSTYMLFRCEGECDILLFIFQSYLFVNFYNYWRRSYIEVLK